MKINLQQVFSVLDALEASRQKAIRIHQETLQQAQPAQQGGQQAPSQDHYGPSMEYDFVPERGLGPFQQ